MPVINVENENNLIRHGTFDMLCEWEMVQFSQLKREKERMACGHVLDIGIWHLACQSRDPKRIPSRRRVVISFYVCEIKGMFFMGERRSTFYEVSKTFPLHHHAYSRSS